ncbi:helix-turn-helix domain-containing protein [Puniceicoccus vermicola]|uniref:Helix-turn-helix transcriptional regulator n=1 Tax=Puniceicoccus vermicola TaxID=388746 RepID=A0A7X1B1W8_9BACT|nr:AraC family transcriptional regulator [Puniceicoccus vermicola]MBC2603013.1 helix-turn-helix transcriptional regulator [Puniceicoccus vermicola]
MERTSLELQKILQGDREAGITDFRWIKKLNASQYLQSEALLRIWVKELVEILEKEGHTSNVPVPTDQRLTQALDLLQNHHGRDFPASPIVEKCSLSLVHLNRLSKERLGHSLSEQWNQVRVRRAQHALSSPDTTIKEIAFDLGFKQPSHFTRWFRQHTGQTPKAYQQKARIAL